MTQRQPVDPARTPLPSRRTVIGGAAWAAPAIVVAAAAPAFAASGPASVTTTVRPASDANGRLPITIDFLNRNTGSTRLTTVIVTLTPTPLFGSVTPGSAVDVTGGWTFLGSGNSTTAPTFSFSKSTGIDGAATSTGTATTTLSFAVTVVPNQLGQSAGTIDVIVSPGNGSVASGDGLWT